MPEFFDIHCHIESELYDEDRTEVINRLVEANTLAISVGTDIESSHKVVTLAKENKNIFACVGIHPRDDEKAIFNEKEFQILVNNPKTVAMGECGLDYFNLEGEAVGEKRRQKKLFEQQINFAIENNKPLMIHCRDAYGDVLDILENYAREYGDGLRGNMHFFAGDMDIARRLLDINFTISFTGVITFARNYDEVIKYIALSSLLSETDAPYVAPKPLRGKRNEPVYVSRVAEEIALIRGEEASFVKKALVQNALRVFQISI